jgi:nitrate reductase delta subunit
VWQEELVVVMNEEKRSLLKVLSVLLQYPDDEFILSLEELKRAVEEIPQVDQREKCMNFLNYLGDNPLIRLQEEYTSTFDLNPATSLNLTYHKWGDARERGNALAELNYLYRKAGYESCNDDLPDYLPLVLEFLSINRLTNTFSFIGQYYDQVKTVGSRLREKDSSYSGILAIVLDIFRELKTNGA